MHPLTIQSSHAMRALAVSASVLAAYAAFSLMERVERAHSFWQSRLWITAAATVLGLGIWSNHFFGALEDPLPGETVYSLPLVILCLLVAVSLSWIAFRIAAWRQQLGWQRRLGGALVLCCSVALVQALGTHALLSSDVVGYSVVRFLIAGVVLCSCTIMGFSMAFSEHVDPAMKEWVRVAGGTVMGVGMAVFEPLATHAVTLVPTSAGLLYGSARGNAVGETALLVTVALVLLVTLGTAAIDKERYRELARLHTELAVSQQALVRSEGQLREANVMLSELSIRDGLTGLYNRRRFDEVFDMEWRRSLRSTRPLALLMIDVDCFKELNDTYGHQRGDDCLREIARILESQPRRGHDVVARFGGEEFAVLLPGADARGAMRIAESIRCAVEAQRIEHKRSGTGPWLTVSVGVSSRAPQMGETPEAMLYEADMALYAAKQRGRNRVETREPVEVSV